MKTAQLAFVGFLLAAFITAQIDSSQIKVKTGGGITGDTSNALTVAPYRGTSAPGSPVTGQLWCDTNATPCILKQYDGAVWNATTSVSVISTQTDLSSFPGSPTEGQCFIDWSHYVQWCWNNTASAWYAMTGSGAHTGSAIVDNFTGTTITAPGSGMVISDGGITGNMAAGDHSCKVTFANSTGGETTMSTVTASVTFTASHKITYSTIPTGGTGTTARRIYCSQAAQAVSGPWYWSLTVNDNSTTTVTADVGVADASLLLKGPQNNYSTALNARWIVTNTTASTTSGGCGATGSSMVCRSSNTNGPQWLTTNTTTDPTVRAAVDLTSYNTGNYTIQYRITKIGVTSSGTDGTANSPQLGAMRVGSSDNAIGFFLGLGLPTNVNNGSNTCANLNWTGPLAANNNGYAILLPRATGGGNIGSASATTCNSSQQARIDTVLWVRFVKYSTTLQAFISRDGQNWTTYPGCAGAANQCINGLSYDVTANNPTQFEIDMSNTVTAQKWYIEIDSFTLTVN